MSYTMNQMDCGRAMEQLDFYLDRELSAAERSELDRHLETCEACALELTNRTELREKLRSAIRGIGAPNSLRDRITATLGETPAYTPHARQWQKWASAIAATVLITTGVSVAYQLGHLRMTTASQQSYLNHISQRVAGIMSVGLGDHVHCSVFRKYPRQAPPPEKIAADMGPQYLPLVQLVRDHLPAGQRVVMAHRCKYHGRQFVHLAMVDGTHLSSLVIADRQPGETFKTSGLVPAMSDAGLPIYSSGVQRFQIDGFETSSHLVYVVSDLPKEMNDRMLASVATPVHDFLTKLEL